jgi:hypothetical protein
VAGVSLYLGFNEQMFGVDEQVPGRGLSDEEALIFILAALGKACFSHLPLWKYLY